MSAELFELANRLIADRLDANLPLGEFLALALKAQGISGFVPYVLSEAARHGNLKYAIVEEKRIEVVRATSIRVSLATATPEYPSTYNQVIVFFGDHVVHFSLEKHHEHASPESQAILNWDIASSIILKLLLYGFTPHFGVENNGVIFCIDGASWNASDTTDRKRLVNHAYELARDFCLITLRTRERLPIRIVLSSQRKQIVYDELKSIT